MNPEPRDLPCPAHRWTAAATLLAVGTASLLATGQPSNPASLIFSANDETSEYREGALRVVSKPRTGSITAIDLATNPPRSWTADNVPCSTVGPPACLAASPSGTDLLVAAAMRVDPLDPTKLTADTRVTWLRFSAHGFANAAQFEVGLQPSSVTFSPDGVHAWVTLRSEGAVALLTRGRSRFRVDRKISLASPADELAHLAVSPDGRTALATLYRANIVLVLAALPDGGLAVRARLPIGAGPYHVRFLPNGRAALVGCTGENTVSLLAASPGATPWTIHDRIDVGRTPEGVAFAPDGKWAAVVCFDGANIVDPQSPWFGQPARVYFFAVTAADRLERRQVLPLEGVPQGVVFSSDSHRLIASQFGRKNLRVFTLADGTWRHSDDTIPLSGQSAALVGAGR